MSNERQDSEHEDNLEIAEWREDKAGSFNNICSLFLPS